MRRTVEGSGLYNQEISSEESYFFAIPYANLRNPAKRDARDYKKERCDGQYGKVHDYGKRDCSEYG